VALDLKKRTTQELAVPAVVHFYLWLLQGYDTPLNTPALNHALCSFLWRLVLPEHLNLEPMLYQVGLGGRGWGGPVFRGDRGLEPGGARVLAASEKYSLDTLC